MVERSPTEQEIIERYNLPPDISGGEIIKRFATPQEIQRINQERVTPGFQEEREEGATIEEERQRLGRTLQLSPEETAALTARDIEIINYKRTEAGRGLTTAQVEERLGIAAPTVAPEETVVPPSVERPQPQPRESTIVPRETIVPTPMKHFVPIQETIISERPQDFERSLFERTEQARKEKEFIVGAASLAVPVGTAYTGAYISGKILSAGLFKLALKSPKAAKVASTGLILGGVQYGVETVTGLYTEPNLKKALIAPAEILGFQKGGAKYGVKLAELSGIRTTVSGKAPGIQAKFEAQFEIAKGLSKEERPLISTAISKVQDIPPKVAGVVQKHLAKGEYGEVLFGSLVAKTRLARDIDVSSKSAIKSTESLFIKLTEAGVKDIKITKKDIGTARETGKIFIGKTGERTVKIEIHGKERLEAFPWERKKVTEPSGLKRISEIEQLERKIVGSVVRGGKDIVDTSALIKKLSLPPGGVKIAPVGAVKGAAWFKPFKKPTMPKKVSKVVTPKKPKTIEYYKPPKKPLKIPPYKPPGKPKRYGPPPKKPKYGPPGKPPKTPPYKPILKPPKTPPYKPPKTPPYTPPPKTPRYGPPGKPPYMPPSKPPVIPPVRVPPQPAIKIPEMETKAPLRKIVKKKGITGLRISPIKEVATPIPKDLFKGVKI